MEYETKCPVCGCENGQYISVNDVHGYANLHIHKLGSVLLNVCLNCGVVYLEPYYINKLKEANNVKEKD